MIYQLAIINLRLSTLVLVAVAFGTGLTASLCAQHTDIEITVANGVLITDPRIGEGEFGESPNPPNVANEPGFEADDGELQPGDLIGFNALGLEIEGVSRNLWYWDGEGSPSFGPAPTIPASHELSIEHPLLGFTTRLTDAAGASTVSGFLIAAADSEGGLHQDLEFVLVDAAGGDVLPPAAGVYLFGLELTSPSYVSSEPVYFVLASDVSEPVHEAAVDYVATTFQVPEASAFALMAAFGASSALVLGRRRTAWNYART